MNDLAALFGDLGDYKEDIKVYGAMGVGGVGAIVGFNWIQDKLRGAVGSPLGVWTPVAFNAVEIGAGLAAARFLPRLLRPLGHWGGLLTQGATLFLVADGILKMVGSVAGALGKASPLPSVSLGNADQDVLFQRYLAAAPVTVERSGLSAAPVSVEMAGFGKAAATLS
jgi:hypothetical protein